MVVYRLVPCLLLAVFLVAGCGPNQTVKNAWKGTKSLWYGYVNTPASINYGDAGKMPAYEARFAEAFMSVDTRLQALERVMRNADKPPTPQWLHAFFAQFPWVDGIIGLNEAGGVVGQAGIEKPGLDFGPLLEADPKQNIRALRGHVQDSEFILAVPLYADADFLGVVAAYFNMNSLMRYSDDSDCLIITSPDGVLWSGRDIPGDPLNGRDWAGLAASSSSGTLSFGTESYLWASRFLGNYPLIFATLKSPDSPGRNAKTERVTDKNPEPPHAGDETIPAPVQSDAGFTLEPLPKL